MPASRPSARPARERILEAASRVFAREGLHGATTRLIAKEAEVNEVTLFRLFESKERILRQVLAMTRQAQSDELACESAWSDDLAADLRAHAQSFNAMLEKNEAMIRTFIGEARRQPQHAQQIVQEAIRPAREAFIGRLEAAKSLGQVRADVDLAAAADMFTGMLLAGMLRRTGGNSAAYAPQTYLDTCVSIFLAGLAPVDAAKIRTRKKLPQS